MKREYRNFTREEKIKAVNFLKTDTHPNFPTDMQAQMMALMTLSQGSNIFYETIFEIIYNLKDVNFILNIEVNNTYIKLKYLFDKNIKGLKQKLEELKLERITVIDEKNNEDETKLEVRILRGES